MKINKPARSSVLSLVPATFLGDAGQMLGSQTGACGEQVGVLVKWERRGVVRHGDVAWQPSGEQRGVAREGPPHLLRWHSGSPLSLGMHIPFLEKPERKLCAKSSKFSDRFGLKKYALGLLQTHT